MKDNEDNHVFYDKLAFIYLGMPKYTKTEAELVTMFDKWMYALHNLSRLMERPQALQERIFDTFSTKPRYQVSTNGNAVSTRKA